MEKYNNPIILKTDDMTMRFGGVVAVNKLNLKSVRARLWL